MPTIKQRPDDSRFQTKIRINGRRHTITGATYKEVEEQLLNLQIDARQGRPPSDTKETIAQYLDWWLATCSTPSPNSMVNREDCVRLHIKPLIGNVKVAKLKPTDVQWMINQCAKKPSRPRNEGDSDERCAWETGSVKRLSYQRVRAIYLVLHKALEDGVSLRRLTHNPLKGVKIQIPGAPDPDRQLWTPDELGRFLADQINRPTRYAPLWVLLATTTIRRSEALGLTWGQIDWKKGAIRITQACTWVRNKAHVRIPKTRTSKRTIGLSALALQALQDLRNRREQEPPRPGLGTGGADFVFLTEHGNHPNGRNLLYRFHEACRRAGVREIQVKEIRKVSASILAEFGAPVKSVQARLGHSTINTTLDIYTKLLSPSEIELVRLMNERLPQLIEQPGERPAGSGAGMG